MPSRAGRNSGLGYGPGCHGLIEDSTTSFAPLAQLLAAGRGDGRRLALKVAVVLVPHFFDGPRGYDSTSSWMDESDKTATTQKVLNTLHNDPEGVGHTS